MLYLQHKEVLVMEEFKKLNFFQKRKLSIDNLSEYYRRERDYNIKHNVPYKNIGLRRKIHGLFHALLKVELKVKGISYKKVRDDRVKTDKPRIYACTHIGRYDLETLSLAIGEDAYVVWGDPGEGYRNDSMIFFGGQGYIAVDTDRQYKEDRHNCLEGCVRFLKQGGALWIYPEGAWNIHENKVVGELFTGAIEMAIKTGADIIPIALDYECKDYKAIVGKNISYEGVPLDEKIEKTLELRDILASLKWELIEAKGIYKRSEIETGNEFLYEIMKDSSNSYDEQAIIASRYHGKIPSPDEVMDSLSGIKVSPDSVCIIKELLKYKEEKFKKRQDKELFLKRLSIPNR